MLAEITEHYNGMAPNKVYDFKGNLPFIKEDYVYQFSRKKRNEKLDCFRISSDIENAQHSITNSYFIGVDWIIEKQHAIYIEPKLNNESRETNYLSMLFSALKHSEVAAYTEDLYEIKWDKEQIEITQQQDLLTPLMVVQYLRIVKEIVRKGLKKSYYKVESNLYAKVKGKVLVSQTIKKNLFNNKPLNTYCSYEEFGLNSLENRLLKKALVFIQRYLPNIKNLKAEEYTTEVFNYINPAFEFVSEEVNLNDIKYTKTNIFYKEYEEAIRLAKLILKRFGYNISNTEQNKILTPPFWIDMSKLFELYVLGLLKDQFKNKIVYHPTYDDHELDYLLLDPPMVIDAKYKPKYLNIEDKEDARQLSAYARLQKVHEVVGYTEGKIIDCLIIYPDQDSNNKDLSAFDSLIKDPNSESKQYVRFFKIGIELPLVK